MKKDNIKVIHSKNMLKLRMMTETTISAVSVVIISYNREELVKRIISRLDGQDFNGDIEIIVADDGSDPRYDINNGNIVYLWTPDIGYTRASTFNRGWRAASYDIVIFLDDDCIPRHDSFIKGHLAGLRNADICRGNLFVWKDVTADGAVTGSPEQVRDIFVTSNTSFRRNVLEELQGIDEDFSGWYGWEDFDLGFRAEDAGFSIVPGDSRTEADHVGRLWPDEHKCRRNLYLLVSKHPARFPEMRFHRRAYRFIRRWFEKLFQW